MSAPVDVLAVMDNLASFTCAEAEADPGNSTAYARWQDAEQARAAVAELVENYQQMVAVFEKQADLIASGCKDIPCPRMEARDKYRAALAKFGGAA